MKISIVFDVRCMSVSHEKSVYRVTLGIQIAERDPTAKMRILLTFQINRRKQKENFKGTLMQIGKFHYMFGFI